MDQLRWILLALGALFIGALAWWEMRRPRHAARGEQEQMAARDTQMREPESGMSASAPPAVDLPEIRSVDARRDPPILMLDEVRVTDGTLGVDVALEVAVDRPGSHDLAADDSDVPLPPLHEVPIRWPPERQDRIIWLRVVPAAGERFNGRALRQALSGNGLLHGPQDIFHLADDQGAVIASAASLTRPGSFDLDVMDTQGFAGIHLFSVLPGPLTPRRTFNELLALARDLAARLSASIQDERGQPLTPQGIDELRDSLREDSQGGEAGPDEGEA